MANIKLYKDNELVLDKDGTIDKFFYIFENITYDKERKILTREDENFCFFLDFENEMSKITIKENNYELQLKLTIKNQQISNEFHEIVYNIESEEKVENKIQISF